MRDTATDPSVRSLLTDIFARLTVLLRKELDLARSEMAQNLNRAALGAGLVVVAAILALTALNVLAVAAVIGLQAAGMDLIWATLAIGAAGIAIAAILAIVGVQRLKPCALAPTRTERDVRRNIDAVKEAFDA